MTAISALLIVAWALVVKWLARARVSNRLAISLDPRPRFRPRRPPASSRGRELAEAVDELGSALTSGVPLADAFRVASESTTGTLRDELAEVATDLRRDPHGALDRWQARNRQTDVALVVSALALGHATGGDRVRAIAVAATTLRERAALHAEVRVQTAQARLSALVVALMPLGFLVLATATDRRTTRFLASPPGVVIVTIALVLDGIGAWWMMRLTRRVVQWP